MVSIAPSEPRNGHGLISHCIKVIAEGYRSLVTQIFDSGSDYVDNDSVFAVKNGLTVDFVPRKDDAKAKLQLEYNMSLGAL